MDAKKHIIIFEKKTNSGRVGRAGWRAHHHSRPNADRNIVRQGCSGRRHQTLRIQIVSLSFDPFYREPPKP